MMIRETTGRGTWGGEDDPSGAIFVLEPGILVIRHSQSVHREIEEILDAVDQAKRRIAGTDQ
jgi:hypothetical protein